MKIKRILLKVVFVGVLPFLAGVFVMPAGESKASAPIIKIEPDEQMQKAVFSVAKVFGRGGCGDYQLAQKVAKWSLKNQIDPALEASIITVESHCDPLAVSSSHAIGLGQILVKTWSHENDFSKINLFNPDENLDLSTRILHNLLTRYSLRQAVLHYGTMEDTYADKVLGLMGRN